MLAGNVVLISKGFDSLEDIEAFDHLQKRWNS